jgi:hypothetical protein
MQPVFQATTQMSALLPIADQDQKGWNVSDVPGGDIEGGRQPGHRTENVAARPGVFACRQHGNCP